MKLKQKFKDMWRKVRGETTAKKSAPRRAATDAEISVEEVTREEIFPEGKRKVTEKKQTATSNRACKKKPSERTRPTNRNYRMIDPDGGSCDTSKS